MKCNCGPCIHCIMKRVQDKKHEKEYPEEYE
jgi:hypothetical protein